MSAIARPRRFAVALTGVICAVLLFRSQIASALLTRGDDLLHANDVAGAIRAYSRAAWLDGSSPAADRLAFSLLVRRGRGDAGAALAAAGRGLRARPHDPALLADRAFAAQQLRRWQDAERDFAGAAAAARDPRYAHLAARMAERRHDRRSARAHLQAALALNPAYGPARRALAASER